MILFIQFYNKYRDTWIFNNGFSNVYGSCKGDFLWIKDYEAQRNIPNFVEYTSYGSEIRFSSNTFYNAKDKTLILKNTISDLPIKKGKVFISCCTTEQVHQSYLWAIKYPKIKFIIGGAPLILNQLHWNKNIIPKNLILKDVLIEKFFKATEWGIELPKRNFKSGMVSQFITNNCYWGKCVFCTYKKGGTTKELKNLKGLSQIENKTIFIINPALTVEQIKQLPKLSKQDIKFVMYIRGDIQTANALAEVLPYCNCSNLTFAVGIEFPSNNVLSKMNKGLTAEDLYFVIKLLTIFNCSIITTNIVGLNGLIEEDVVNLGKWWKKVHALQNKKLRINIYNIRAKLGSILGKGGYNNVEKIGPFQTSCVLPKLDNYQIALNKWAIKQMVGK